ncbi:hypothetical protein BDZ91DRAFT_418399 [Kalaharituber pfeilii]|nr:hypothetical protein BDZ91DRAFT_418399 [Kalaharituber pfeilii]
MHAYTHGHSGRHSPTTAGPPVYLGALVGLPLTFPATLTPGLFRAGPKRPTVLGTSNYQETTLPLAPPIDTNTIMCPEEFYQDECEPRDVYYSARPAPTRYITDMQYEQTSPGFHPHTNGFLLRRTAESFTTADTGMASSSHSFATSGHCTRSSSSLQTRSRSSTNTTAQSTAIQSAFIPPPIPYRNTFVDELITSPVAGGEHGGKGTDEAQVMATERNLRQNVGLDATPQYPSPWGKKSRGGWFGWFKRWGRRKQELDFEARYDIWVSRHRERNGGY